MGHTEEFSYSVMEIRIGHIFIASYTWSEMLVNDVFFVLLIRKDHE